MRGGKTNDATFCQGRGDQRIGLTARTGVTSATAPRPSGHGRVGVPLPVIWSGHAKMPRVPVTRRPLRRGSAHPLEVLACVQPRPDWRICLVGAAQGHHAARHRRLHAPSLVRPPARHPRAGRARAVPAQRRPEREVPRQLPPRLASAEDPVRFMLSVEISTIYKRDERTRKVHHLVYLPDLDAVQQFNARLARIGNLGSDGRPILGLDSRDLLEITLEASADGFLVPAHIWTPWFSALGSKSGFDAIADCYADLADHIFAVETGLSSDPEMNWRVSASTRTAWCPIRTPTRPRRWPARRPCSPPRWTTSASASAAHRRRAARHDRVLPGGGQVPRRRAPRLRGQLAAGADPGGRRPLPRVRQAAHRRGAAPGRGAGRPARRHRPPGAPARHAPGPAARDPRRDPRGRRRSRRPSRPGSPTLVAALGPELAILLRVPVDEIARAGGELLGRGRRPAAPRPGAPHPRLRRRVRRDPALRTRRAGRRAAGGDALFDVPVPQQRPAATAPARRSPPARRPAAPPRRPTPRPRRGRPPAAADRRRRRRRTSRSSRCSPAWRRSAPGCSTGSTRCSGWPPSAPGGPLLIVAGPGTGKTRTLTHRIAYLCAELDVYPEQCLAITFTRRAAEEMRDRLDGAARAGRRGRHGGDVPRAGLPILRENAAAAGLPAGFRVADEHERAAARGRGRRRRRRRYAQAAARAGPGRPRRAGHAAGERCCASDPDLVDRYRRRWPWIFVDEYQDVDATQYELLRLLVPAGRQPVRDRRPGPGHLLVPRRGRGVFLRFARGLHRRPGGPADPQLPLRRADPRRRGAGHRAVHHWCADGGWTRPGSTRTPRWSGCTRRRPRPTRRTSWSGPSTSWSAGCRTGRSTPAGSTRARGRGSVSFSDIAVLYRTDAQAGADHGRPDPGRRPGAEALARPAAGPARGRRDRPRAALRRRARRPASRAGSGWPPGARRPARRAPALDEPVDAG